MGNVYLVDRPSGQNGLDLALVDGEAKVVLVQDGVYLDVASLHVAGAEIYAVERDVEKRGLRHRLPGYINVINYGRLVDLVVENRVVNFV